MVTTIRPVLERANESLYAEVKRIQTVGYLRRVARDVAAELFSVHDETAEVVAFQNALEKSLNQFVEAMGNPVAAMSYVAPDQVRGRIAASGRANKVELEAAEEGQEF